MVETEASWKSGTQGFAILEDYLGVVVTNGVVTEE